MEPKMLARLGAILFVAVAMTATVLEFARQENNADMPDAAPVRTGADASDPLRAAQRRCQLLGQHAAADAGCLRVWAETRDRFLRRPPPLSSEGR